MVVLKTPKIGGRRGEAIYVSRVQGIIDEIIPSRDISPNIFDPSGSVRNVMCNFIEYYDGDLKYEKDRFYDLIVLKSCSRIDRYFNESFANDPSLRVSKVRDDVSIVQAQLIMHFYDVRVLYNDIPIFITTISLYNNTFKETIRNGVLQSLGNANTIDIFLFMYHTS